MTAPKKPTPVTSEKRNQDIQKLWNMIGEYFTFYFFLLLISILESKGLAKETIRRLYHRAVQLYDLGNNNRNLLFIHLIQVSIFKWSIPFMWNTSDLYAIVCLILATEYENIQLNIEPEIQKFAAQDLRIVMNEVKLKIQFMRIPRTAHTMLLQMCNLVTPTDAVTRWAIVLLDSFVLGNLKKGVWILKI